MAAFIFIVRQAGGTWNAKQHGGGAGALETSSASTWELQRKLTSLVLAFAGTNCAVSSSFTLITPTSAIAQVMLTGAGIYVGPALPAAAAAVPAPGAPPEVDKEEDDSDDDTMESIFGPGLWD